MERIDEKDNFVINKDFDLSIHHVGQEKRIVAVIDNFLLEPECLYKAAIDVGSFKEYIEFGNYYPGIRAAIPAAYQNAICDGLREIFSNIFGVSSSRRAKTASCYSLTTTKPEDLSILQKLPHFDSFDSDFFAVLHYLCNESYGGTAFFRHQKTGYESIDRERMKEYWPVVEQELQDSGEPRAAYIDEETKHYEKTAEFTARYNRLLIYRGKMLHAGIIKGEKSLSPDPSVGRLTANSFISFPI